MKVREIIDGNTVWMPNQQYSEITPEVTITLPTYRRAKSGFFKRAVDSVLKQKFRNFELIIIDDGSTDGTADLIESYMARDRRVSCLRHIKNVGLPCIGSFEAFMKARGTYLAYMFDDNTWNREFLLRTIKYMKENNSKATYGKARSYDGEGNYVDLAVNDLSSLSYSNFVGNGAVVLHREVVETIGFYDPHLALTRLCDWDFWKRIVLHYDFEFTGISACKEHGVALSDSLGNSLKLSKWTSLEQTQRDRCEKLRPENFLEYDILDSDDRSTDYFKSVLSTLYENYSDKYWFSTTDDSFVKLKEATDPAKSRKRILVLLPMFDATFLLGFNRMSLIDSDYIFFPVHLNAFSEIDLCYVDAVIVVRDVFSIDHIAAKCKNFGIPTYFFLDDNYIAIANDLGEASVPQARFLIENKLENVDGVLVSSEKMLEAMSEYEIHDNLSIFRPILTSCGQTTEDDIITYAFMGGGFREKIFAETVMPAISKISKEHDVRVVCPSSLKGKIPQKFTENLELIYIDWLFSVDTIVNRYKKYNVDFLIHCGPDLENNKYKTENSLINAVQLGAVLVASNFEPYNLNPLIYCSNNTIKEWTECLKGLLEDHNAIEQNKESCQKYCMDKYSAHSMNSSLHKVFDSVNCSKMSDNLMRCDAVIANLISTNRDNVLNSANYSTVIDCALSFSKPIESATRYKLQPSCPFTELGIILSVDGTVYPNGKIKLNVYQNGELQMSSKEYSMSDIRLREMTYFRFPDKIPPEELIVEIETKYDDFSAQNKIFMGVYENRATRDFWYKVLCKLGMRPLKKNVLFYDVR